MDVPIKEIGLVIVINKLINYDNDWIVDFDCSNHMIGHKEKLLDMSEYKWEQVVVTTNNFRLLITHIGKVVIAPCFSPQQVQVN